MVTSSVCVIIPTYNEKDNIQQLCHRILEIVPDIKILVVDDNSPDGTAAVVEAMQTESPDQIFIMKREKKEGLGAAYLDAIAHVLNTFPEVTHIVQMDADFSHEPGCIPALLAKNELNDLVIGSRYIHGSRIVNWPFHRLAISKLGTIFARTVTRLPVIDCTSGFKSFKVSALRNIPLCGIKSNGYAYQLEMNYRFWQHGYRIEEYPIVFHERINGESKLDWKIGLESLWTVMRLALENIFTK